MQPSGKEMSNIQRFVDIDLDFKTSTDALTHIGQFLVSRGYVKESYLPELLSREKNYPTGIDLGFGAIAIPHCESSHAIEPCIYLIRPQNAVAFVRADGDDTIDAELIIALVVTSPHHQMALLKALFSSLRDENFYTDLKTCQTKIELEKCFNEKVLIKE